MINMSHTPPLSLKEAILININVMLGTGIFINTVLLSKNAGLLSGGLYLFNGLLVLPLIVSMTALMRIHPRGGFYTFGAQEISPFAGFLSAWAYFIGKLASATLMVHTALSLIQTIIPALQGMNTLALDCCVLTLFTGLNLLRMGVGVKLQSATFLIKLIPILFVIGCGFFLFSPAQWVVPHSIMPLIQSMPLVLFTSLGFEATLSLSNRIENPQINGPRAIVTAFAVVVSLSCLFQTFFYCMLGTTLAHAPNYLSAFPALLTKVLGSAAAAQYASILFHLAITVSALGSAYGILFSTHWNLHTIAQHGHIFYKKLFTRLNKHAIPTAGIVLQGVICLFYVLITRGNQVPLQIVASFGCIIAYTTSILALLYAHRHIATSVAPWVIYLALLNCTFFIASSVYSLVAVQISSFVLFAVLLLAGICMFVLTRLRA